MLVIWARARKGVGHLVHGHERQPRRASHILHETHHEWNHFIRHQKVYEAACKQACMSRYVAKTLKKPHNPSPLKIGIVALSSHPNKSTTSLAAATTPDHTLTIPSASHPPTLPSSLLQPRAPLTTAGNPSLPVNMKPSLYSHRQLTQPQKTPAVSTPVPNAARLPARLFPFLIRGVYRPYNLPTVLAAVSHQLNSNTLTVPTSLGANLRTVHAPSRYQITPLYPPTSLSRIMTPSAFT